MTTDSNLQNNEHRHTFSNHRSTFSTIHRSGQQYPWPNKKVIKEAKKVGQQWYVCWQMSWSGGPIWLHAGLTTVLRPFRLTRTIARARVSTRANLSAHAICRTHEKSYSAEKVLFHRIFFFQSFVFVYNRHLWIMRYMSIAYCRRWLRWPEHHPKRNRPSLYILYAILNFFLLYKYTI